VSPDQLERLCRLAVQRLQWFINRSAAQHMRRLRESWRKP